MPAAALLARRAPHPEEVGGCRYPLGSLDRGRSRPAGILVVARNGSPYIFGGIRRSRELVSGDVLGRSGAECFG